jgi:hypothetical protein
MRDAGDLTGVVVRTKCQVCAEFVWAKLTRTSNPKAAAKSVGRNAYANHCAVCPACGSEAFDHWNWYQSADQATGSQEQ